MSGPGPSPEFRAHAKRFWLATNGAEMRSGLLGLASGILVGVAAIAAIAATGSPGFTLGIVIIATLLAVGVTLLPYRTPKSREAAELVRDHACREAKEWADAFGSPPPRTLKGCERWLREHPTGPGRASLLISLGRLDEAARELDSRPLTTPEGPFEMVLMRAQIATYRGQAPDIEAMRALLATLPDSRRQAARRQCIVTVQAWQAANQGEDAVAVLARGRRVIGILDPASSIERQLLRRVRFPLAIGLGTTVGVIIGGL